MIQHTTKGQQVNAGLNNHLQKLFGITHQQDLITIISMLYLIMVNHERWCLVYWNRS